MQTTRRHLLKAAAAAPLAIADGPWLSRLAAYGADAPPDQVQFGPDLEPIVRLIERTPRKQCVPVFVEQLRRGLPYRRFLAGTFFACVRKTHSHHDVYKIHSVHQVSRDVRSEERLLPLFWAINAFKQRQEDFPLSPLAPLEGRSPSAANAAMEFREAMRHGDLDRAEPALVALARAQGARRTMEQLWPYGCRNGEAGGHMAIVLANTFRTLEAIGWDQAEHVLRFVLRDWYAFQRARPDRHYEPNWARVEQHLAHLPMGWTRDGANQAATRELFGRIRAGQAEPACALAVQQLRAGVGAQAVWDAVHLGTAELLVRHASGWGLASRPLHSNTSTNALHHGFRTATASPTRLLVLLQAVAWAADKTNGDRTSGALRDLSITELAPAVLPPTDEEAVAEIFALLPARNYRWDTRRGALLHYGQRADADEACRKVFALASQRPQAVPLLVQTAHSWLCRKASNDHHEYKFLAAILEDVGRVSPPWRPHLLAASVHYFHGNQSPDNAVVEQARDALGRMGQR
jgi:hypothetical protein